MSHRAKHRRAALLRRVQQGRTTKTDLTVAGRLEYKVARFALKHAAEPPTQRVVPK